MYRTEYCLVGDDSGHHYIIPFDKIDDWNHFMEIPDDDPTSWNVPGYAERLDGGRLVFSNWRIA